MCMLTFFPEGVQPNPNALTNGAITNDDGHGFAIVAGKRLIVRKSLNYKSLIAEFTKLRRKHPDGPALFHSRWGTGGRMDEFNCHPFRFGGDRRTVVAHNGILPASVQPREGEPRCDTRIAADHVIGKVFGHLSSGDNRASLAKWIGPANKLVILTVNPKYPERAYIINENAGVWDGGIWYSNHDYRDDMSLWVAARHGWKSTPGECLICHPEDANVDPETGYCLTCETCTDCLEMFDDCLCYVPGASKGPDPESYEEEYAAWWAQQQDEEAERAIADKRWWTKQERASQAADAEEDEAQVITFGA